MLFRRYSRGERAQTSSRGMFERHVVPGGPDESHNYLLVCPQTRSAVLIDAAGDAAAILREIQRLRARVRMILLTHGHPDRWEALGRLRDTLGVPVGIHLEDAEMLPLTPNFALSHNQRIAFDAAELHVFHTPGHTPGSVCLFGDGNLFSGDVLHAGAPGETTPPLGNFALMMRSLRQELFTLPNTTSVYPAHGNSTTIGVERPSLETWEMGRA
ncbi:MAG: MBL fold metallo-hydrolase [Ktedonobacterales bacterium]|nr:MBL fold metallo-hydrolase [Ktedonobacterales bacterium]